MRSALVVCACCLLACGGSAPADGAGGGEAQAGGGAAGTGGGSATGGGKATGGGEATGGSGGGTQAGGPTVVLAMPSPGSVGVATGTAIVLAFSESMRPSSVSLSASPAMRFEPPAWGSDDTEVSFVPAERWQDSTEYTITVTGESLTGLAMTPWSFSFTTAGGDDETPPTLVSSTPADGASDVAPATALSLTFSEPMAPGVVVAVTPSITLGAAAWSDGNRTVSYPAAAGCAPGTAYTVSVEGEDLAGNALPETSFGFTTGVSSNDTVPPLVVSTVPPPGTFDVSVGTAVEFLFSEPMATQATQSALSATPSIACDFSWLEGDKRLRCTPTTPLTGLASYTVTMGVGAKDKAGNALTSPWQVSFTTAEAPFSHPLTIASTTPTTSQGNVTPGVPVATTSISVTFSAPMNKASAQSAFSITSPTGLGGGGFSWNTAGTTMTYAIPGAPLAHGTEVHFKVSSSAKDGGGNALQASSTFVRQFRLRRQGWVNIYGCNTCVPTTPHGTCQPTGTCTEVAPSGTERFNPNQCNTIDGQTPGVAQWGIYNQWVSRALLTFKMPTMGAAYPNLEYTEGTLHVYQTGCVGDAYGTCSGIGCTAQDKLHLYGVSYGSIPTNCPIVEATGGPMTPKRSYALWLTSPVNGALASPGARQQFSFHRPQPWVTGTQAYCSIATQSNTDPTIRPYISAVYEYD